MKYLLLPLLFLLAPLGALADTISVNHATAYAGPNGNTAVGTSPLALSTCSITTVGDVSVHIWSPDLSLETEVGDCGAATGYVDNSITNGISGNAPSDPQPWDYSWLITGTYYLYIANNADPDWPGEHFPIQGEQGVLYVAGPYTLTNDEPPVPATMATAINIPSATTSLSAAAAWSGAEFSTGSPVVWAVAGMLIAVAILLFFITPILSRGYRNATKRRKVYYKQAGPNSHRLVRYKNQRTGRAMYNLQQRGYTDL